ncbi:MAG: response regulator [Nitrospira sp. CR2.1]|nr:response regulator [Nitrospira sp. CR2.1]
MEGYGKRVLVADGEASVRRFVMLVLEQVGYIVHEAADGFEAVGEMKKRRFDVVVADYRMPRLDGEQFLILSRLMWPQIPTILLSAELRDVPGRLSLHGPCAFLEKPFDSQRLVGVVREALEMTCGCPDQDAVTLPNAGDRVSLSPS